MNAPCPSFINCPEGNTAYPIQNLSSEAPDIIGFFGIGFPPLLDAPDSPGTGPGHFWSAHNCFSTCISSVSQQEADQCAALEAYLCDNGGSHNPSPVFFSNQQACSLNCPDGLPFVYTVPAGRFVGATQQQADIQAHQYACQQAHSHQVCLSGLTPNTGHAGQPYVGMITATGQFISNNPLNLWQMTSGSLPHGVTFGTQFAGNTVQITGTPTQGGTFTFNIRVTDTAGDYMEKTFTLSVTANRSTSTALAFSPGYELYTGESITFIATVTGNVGVPTGTVTFKNAGVAIGTAPLVAGVATFPVSLPNGANPITAVYGGDSNNDPSTSPVVTITIEDACNPALGATIYSASAAAAVNALDQQGNVIGEAMTADGFGDWCSTAMSGNADACLISYQLGPNTFALEWMDAGNNLNGAHYTKGGCAFGTWTKTLIGQPGELLAPPTLRITRTP